MNVYNSKNTQVLLLMLFISISISENKHGGMNDNNSVFDFYFIDFNFLVPNLFESNLFTR